MNLAQIQELGMRPRSGPMDLSTSVEGLRISGSTAAIFDARIACPVSTLEPTMPFCPEMNCYSRRDCLRG